MKVGKEIWQPDNTQNSVSEQTYWEKINKKRNGQLETKEEEKREPNIFSYHSVSILSPKMT